ncbi:unnamed protein product [Citrullus colocynthis]|uniref:Uncharacterized protein n=1 Tax=Citrullus colocynthis TaxID=252529 RepID=A0ABP0YBQ0_9ROSI
MAMGNSRPHEDSDGLSLSNGKQDKVQFGVLSFSGKIWSYLLSGKTTIIHVKNKLMIAVESLECLQDNLPYSSTSIAPSSVYLFFNKVFDIHCFRPIASSEISSVAAFKLKSK